MIPSWANRELSEAEENEKHIQAESAFINRITKSIS